MIKPFELDKFVGEKMGRERERGSKKESRRVEALLECLNTAAMKMISFILYFIKHTQRMIKKEKEKETHSQLH